MRFQSQRGTHDILPGVRKKDREYEVARWQHAEAVFQELAHLYGYGEVRTPMFEDYELFVRSSGETSDIVSKEMYDFFDKGERHIALKPEGTAPVMRAYLENQLGQPGHTTRLCYQTPAFRYGRPGKGRVRQLHQFGFELIGSSAAAADAEIMQVTVEFFRRIGLRGAKLLLNTIGRHATRATYGDVILRHAACWLKDQDLGQQAQSRKNPLRLLDTKDPSLKDALADVPPLCDYLEPASRDHFEQVKAELTESGVEFVVSQSVVRGLDYYTDTVFEVVGTDLGEDTSLCGGGRYDDLIGDLGGPPTPSVGVGIGIERLLICLAMQGAEPSPRIPAAFVVAATEGARAEVRGLVASLRAEGLSALRDIDGKNLKGQFKQADRSGAPYAVVIGDDELAQGSLTLKDLRSGEQSPVQRDRIADRLREK